MNLENENDMFSIRGKHTIGTGGTKGLCLEIARAYHAAGAEVVI